MNGIAAKVQNPGFLVGRRIALSLYGKFEEAIGCFSGSRQMESELRPG
jgi:hypothetical protein